MVVRAGPVLTFGDNSKGITEDMAYLNQEMLSVNKDIKVTLDDTLLPNIQTENPSEQLKFDDMSDSDDENPPEVVNGEGDSGGNISNNGDTTNTGEESPRHSANNSGGGNEGSTSYSQHHNVKQGESSRSNIPSQTVWNRAHSSELIIDDPGVGIRTRSATQNKCHYSWFLSGMEPKKTEEALTDPD